MRLFRIIFPIAILIVFLGCDPKTELSQDILLDQPLRNLVLTPSIIEFEPADGIKDTVVSIDVVVDINYDDLLNLVQSNNISLEDVEAELILRRNLDTEPELVIRIQEFSSDQQQFSGSFSLATTTVSFTDYLVYARLQIPKPSNQTIQSKLRIRGFPAGDTFIESVQHPDTVFIPAQGEVMFTIGAVAKNTVDNAVIDQVFVDLYDQNGVMLGGEPFALSPDFDTADQFFAETFRINAGNQPDDIQLEFYAIDIFGASSDTLRSSFLIRR